MCGYRRTRCICESITPIGPPCRFSRACCGHLLFKSRVTEVARISQSPCRSGSGLTSACTIACLEHRRGILRTRLLLTVQGVAGRACAAMCRDSPGSAIDNLTFGPPRCLCTCKRALSLLLKSSLPQPGEALVGPLSVDHAQLQVLVHGCLLGRRKGR